MTTMPHKTSKHTQNNSPTHNLTQSTNIETETRQQRSREILTWYRYSTSGIVGLNRLVSTQTSPLYSRPNSNTHTERHTIRYLHSIRHQYRPHTITTNKSNKSIKKLKNTYITKCQNTKIDLNRSQIH